MRVWRWPFSPWIFFMKKQEHCPVGGSPCSECWGWGHLLHYEAANVFSQQSSVEHFLLWKHGPLSSTCATKHQHCPTSSGLGGWRAAGPRGSSLPFSPGDAAQERWSDIFGHRDSTVLFMRLFQPTSYISNELYQLPLLSLQMLYF